MKIDPEIVELLEKPVNIKRLIKRLYFKVDQLEDAALDQPTLHLRAGRFQAQAALQASDLRRRLAKLNAKTAIHVRNKKGEKTETAVKHKVLLYPKMQEYQKRVDHAEAVYEFSKFINESFRERLIVLSILNKLRSAEIGSELRSVKSEERVQHMRKKAHEARRRLEELEVEDE